MAGRPIGKRHQEDVRRKIQASVLITGLHDYFIGKKELDPGRVNAAKILLNKVLPDLTSISGDPLGQPLKAEVKVTWE